jgi:hypothetical protein
MLSGTIPLPLMSAVSAAAAAVCHTAAAVPAQLLTPAVTLLLHTA